MVKTQNMNALLLLGVFLLQTLAKPFNGTLDDISWIIGENDDSVVDTCRRIGQQPLNTDLTTISWNRTSFDYVVRNILQLNYVGTGLSGCCTSGLWCDGGNCFSQSFGESFINYGRLPNVGDSVKPVFACIKSDKESFVQINKVLLAEKSRLDITGNGLDSGATTEGFLYGERCNNVELCGCQSCSAAVSCSAGSSCYLSSSSPQSFCFELCAGTNDASCPCDRICKNVKDTTGKSVSLCLPPSFTTFVNNCNTFGNDRFMCTANSSLYLSTAGVTNPNISVLVENYGITAKLGPLPTSCKSSADCFDNNLCTIDECVSSMCVYSSAGNCSSVLPHLREQYSPYSYVQYEANDLFHEQQEFAEELVESGQYFAINSKALSTFNTFKVDFWISYFGNLLNSFSISGSGVVSLPPLDDCDNKQVSFYSRFYHYCF